MALLSVPYTFTVGAVIVAAQHNSNFQTIYNDYSGNIQDVNIASNAGIEYSKLSLNNSILADDIKSTEILSINNLPTGTTANKLVELDSSAKLPAVDGSALTGVISSAATISSITDYGTSGSTGTSKLQNFIIIAYGTLAVNGSSSATVTNLTFSSAATYTFIVTSDSDPQNGYFTPFAVRNSGSQVTVYANDSHNINVSWFAIGT